MVGILVEKGNLVVKNGSLKFGRNDEQCCELVVGAYPGEFKNAPTLGCNARMNLNGVISQRWINNTKEQLKAANLKVNDVFYEDELIIDLELD